MTHRTRTFFLSFFLPLPNPYSIPGSLAQFMSAMYGRERRSREGERGDERRKTMTRDLARDWAFIHNVGGSSATSKGISFSPLTTVFYNHTPRCPLLLKIWTTPPLPTYYLLLSMKWFIFSFEDKPESVLHSTAPMVSISAVQPILIQAPLHAFHSPSGFGVCFCCFFFSFGFPRLPPLCCPNSRVQRLNPNSPLRNFHRS